VAWQARAALEDRANEVVVSIVGAWEIAIKQSLGTLELPRPAERWLPEVLRRTVTQDDALGPYGVPLLRA
jgi:PIN domain nuclease of toxin-antitoxin system